MKNKRSLKVMILAAMAAVVTLLCSSCSSDKTMYTGRSKVFETGTHLVSVPFKGEYSAYKEGVQFECPDGYRAVGFGITSGNTEVVLFENIVPVECAETDKGYVVVGTPLKQEKTRALTQEE